MIYAHQMIRLSRDDYESARRALHGPAALKAARPLGGLGIRVVSLFEAFLELVGLAESDDEPEDPRRRRRGRLIRLALLVLILAAATAPGWYPELLG